MSARALLAKGAEVDAGENSADTPLIGAAAVGHAGIVRLLLGAGADVNAQGQGRRLRADLGERRQGPGAADAGARQALNRVISDRAGPARRAD